MPVEAAPAPQPAPTAGMKVTLVMDRAAQDEVVKKLPPTAGALAGRTMSFPIGAEIRNGAIAAFISPSGQALAVSETPPLEGYSLTVRNGGFSWWLDATTEPMVNGLKVFYYANVTFAVDVEMRDPSGTPVFNRTYSRADFSRGCPAVMTFPRELTSFESNHAMRRVKEAVYCSYLAGLQDVYAQAVRDMNSGGG